MRKVRYNIPGGVPRRLLWNLAGRLARASSEATLIGRRNGGGKETETFYLVVLGIGVLALLAVPGAGFGQADDHQNLEPGERADLDERVPVTFVFVGYGRDDVDAGKFLAGLPDEYKPVVRSRYHYNESFGRSLLGLNCTYIQQRRNGVPGSMT